MDDNEMYHRVSMPFDKEQIILLINALNEAKDIITSNAAVQRTLSLEVNDKVLLSNGHIGLVEEVDTESETPYMVGWYVPDEERLYGCWFSADESDKQKGHTYIVSKGE